MKNIAGCGALIFTCIFTGAYAGEASTPSTFGAELVWGTFADSQDGDDLFVIGVTHANIGKVELGSKNQEPIPMKVNFPIVTEQGRVDSYRQRAQHERWFPAGRMGGINVVVKSLVYSQNAGMAHGELNKAFFPMLHMEYRLASGMHPTPDADFPDSYWWNGARLFALDGGDMMLISNDAQAYWITRKTEGVQINPTYKNYALPMRIGANPYMNTLGELPMPMISSSRIGNTIYLVTQDGSFSSVEVTPGQKPKWSPIMEKPFGDHGVYLFPIGKKLAGVYRTDEGRWDIYVNEGIAWECHENIALPADEKPIFIKDTFLLTSIEENDGKKIAIYSIDGMKIERDHRFTKFTLPEGSIIIDATISKKSIFFLLSKNTTVGTELSILSIGAGAAVLSSNAEPSPEAGEIEKNQE